MPKMRHWISVALGGAALSPTILSADRIETTANRTSSSHVFDEVLAPTSELILIGTTSSGGNLASWASNDGDLRTICYFWSQFPSHPLYRMNLEYRTSREPGSVTGLSIRVRVANKTPGPIKITLKIQEWQSGMVNTNVVNLPIGALPFDVVAEAPGDLARFIGPQGQIVIQLEADKNGLKGAAFPCISFDSGNVVVSD